MSRRKHLTVLIALTVIVRGVMFLSYPMGGIDDDQSAQRFIISELTHDNWKVGNLRYNVGYPLIIAPIVKGSSVLGRLDDRLVLLTQIVFSATIPFFVYDLLRRRNTREAFVVALVVALDPFGLQWAHLWLPVWLVAWCLVVALWLADRATRASRHGWRYGALAGLAFGIGILARTEAAVFAAALGGAVLTYGSVPLRQRIAIFVGIGVLSAGVWASYLLTIQRASTGTVRASCMAGIDLLYSAITKDISLIASNGPQTAHLLSLLSLPPLKEIHFLADSYPRWREPGPWATPAEQVAFLNQPAANTVSKVETALPSDLVYYLGLCPVDALLVDVIGESILAHPGKWLAGVLYDGARMLVHKPDSHSDNLYLPRYHLLSLERPKSGLAAAAGFRIADGGYPSPYISSPGGEFYTGQWVWAPGIWLFSVVFDSAGALFWLVPVAMVWSFVIRDRIYMTVAFLLLAGVIISSVFNTVQPRIYASFYPLSSFLLGGFIAYGTMLLTSRQKVNSQ